MRWVNAMARGPTARSGRQRPSAARLDATYRLKDLEARLDPAKFVRLGRGTVAPVDLITKVHLMPGGGYLVHLVTGPELQVSRIQSRVLRERLLRL